MKSLLSNLSCRFFSFITLSISCYFLMACGVSVERSTVSLIGILFYVICCFSFAAFNICSLCLIFVSLINMCLCMFFLGIFPIWEFLDFLNLGGYFLPHIRKFFKYYPLKYFLMSFPFVFFFWDAYETNVGVLNQFQYLKLSERSLILHSFIFLLFSLF